MIDPVEAKKIICDGSLAGVAEQLPGILPALDYAVRSNIINACRTWLTAVEAVELGTLLTEGKGEPPKIGDFAHFNLNLPEPALACAVAALARICLSLDLDNGARLQLIALDENLLASISEALGA